MNATGPKNTSRPIANGAAALLGYGTSGQPARLSAAERAQFLAEDAAWIGKPFEVGGSGDAIQANTRHMARLLQDKSQPDRARRMAIFAGELLDTLIAANLSSKPASSIACAKGCAHCCTTAVSATIPEVLALAAALRADPARARRVRGAAERAATTMGDWWSAARLDCPVLENGTCGAYDARPGACRGLLSTSLSACTEIFHNNTNTPMAYPGASAALRTVAVIMMKAALQVSGLGAAHIALSPALAVALTVPDAEARWLAGDPLFNAAPPDNAERNLYLRSLVEGLAEAIRPTL